MRFTQLPDELVTEILSRAPIKELGSCKCVCKSWRSLIGNPQFRQVYRSRDRGLILYWSETGPWSETGRRTGCFRLYFSPPTPNRRDVEDFRLLRKLNVGSYSGECRLINGLICVRESPSDALSIYSVCTGEKMMVPEPFPCAGLGTYSSYYFRFDPISRRYKLLRLVFELAENLQALHIITLQPSGLQSQWRKLDFDAVGIPSLPAVFLQFLTIPAQTRYSGDGVVCWVSSKLGVIVFDVHQERFRWVKSPADLEVMLKEVPQERRGRMLVPRALFKEQRLAFSLWVLAEEEGDDGLEWFALEDGEGEKWSKHLVSFPREMGVAVLNSDSHWVGKIPEEFLHSDEHHYCNHWDKWGPGFCCRLSFLPNSYDHFHFSLNDLLSGRC